MLGTEIRTVFLCFGGGLGRRKRETFPLILL